MKTTLKLWKFVKKKILPDTTILVVGVFSLTQDLLSLSEMGID